MRFSGWLPVPAQAGWALVALGAVIALVGIVFAFAQTDVKRLLAYCSVENVGVILVGVGAALLARSSGDQSWGSLALAGSLLHVWNHGAFKSLLFFSAGSVLHASGTREMSRLGGLWRTMPWTAGMFALGAIAVSGLFDQGTLDRLMTIGRMVGRGRSNGPGNGGCTDRGEFHQGGRDDLPWQSPNQARRACPRMRIMDAHAHAGTGDGLRRDWPGPGSRVSRRRTGGERVATRLRCWSRESERTVCGARSRGTAATRFQRPGCNTPARRLLPLSPVGLDGCFVLAPSSGDRVACYPPAHYEWVSYLKQYSIDSCGRLVTW